MYQNSLGILQLGDPRLRQRSGAVTRFPDPVLREEARRLYQTLQHFRRRYGFGRATAAPQLGIMRRMIALYLKDWPSVILNPEVTWRSPETVTLWDDCLCFPQLLVRVRRADSISLRYQDIDGHWHERERLDTATSELLQHEIDHLDGVLAIDHALDRDALISREVFLYHRAYFQRQVDFVP